MPKASNKRSKYHHGDLQETLIGHALSIIENEGIGGLTLRKAARYAGVSHAAPAHHFGDMKGLMAAIATRGFTQMAHQMEEALRQNEGANPLGRLKTVGLTYLDYAAKNSSSFKVMYHLEISDQALYPQLEKQSRVPYDMLKTVLRECQDKQLVREGEIEELALFAWSTVHGFANLIIDRQLTRKGLKDDYTQYAESVTNLLYTGLRQ